MLKKALIGLAAVVFLTLVILLSLGFKPAQLVSIVTDEPYEEALEKGSYLDDMVVSVDARELKGTHTFSMRVYNPTPRELVLRGSWSRDDARYTLDRYTVEMRVPSRETKSIDMDLAVTQTDPDGEPISVARFKPPTFEGAWTWEPWSAEGVAALKSIPVKRALVIRRAFGVVNWAVLAAYLGAMLGVGFAASRRIKGTKGFFIAGGRMNFVVVGLSLLGTYLSALTMMGLPAMAYGKHNWTYMAQLPCLIITAIVITSLVLPRYRKAGVVSIYEFLEQRIHISTRMIASVCFLIFAIARMGLVLYLPALAFSTVTGAPLSVCIVAMGIIITAYTAMGGMEAVIWTDAIQVIIFVLAAVVTLAFIFTRIDVVDFIDIGVTHNKFRTIIPGFDIFKITTMWLILETVFQTIRIYGTQQDMAQRFMATASGREAKLSVWIAILGYIPLGFIFYFIGTALFVYYKANVDVNIPGAADPVYPYFVVMNFPAGLSGLIIAAFFAAAMSSIDSLMNSSSTVCVEDFFKRFAKTERTDEQYLRKARMLTLVWGTLAVLMALLFIGAEYAQIVWGKLMGIATNGILGLMALAFLPFRVNKWAAGAGFAVAYVCLFVMMATGVNFLLWPVVGNLACFLTALFLHPLFAQADRTEDKPGA